MKRVWRASIFVILLLCLLTFSIVTLDWRMVSWSLTGSQEFFAPFLSPDLSAAFLVQVGAAAVQTFAMAAVATLVSALVACVLAFAADSGVRWTYLLLFNVMRTIPELLFASVLVLLVGLGSTAGMLALTLHTTGVLGRLFVSALQSENRDAAKALTLMGAGTAHAFLFGLLPQVKTQWLSYTLYRSEMNIRAAAVLGLVGAGGLGQQLHVSLSLFQYHKASTLILATLLLVILSEAISRHVRHNRFSNAQIE